MLKLLNLLGTALVLVGLSGCGGGSGDQATSNPTPGALSSRDFAADPSLRLQSGQTAVMNVAATDAPCPTQGPCTAPGPVLIPIHLANATTLTHTIDPDVLAQTLSTLRHVELRDSSGKVLGALNPTSTRLAVTLEAGDYTIALYPGFTLADEPAGSRVVFLHPQPASTVALKTVRPVERYSASDLNILLSSRSCPGCDLSGANLSYMHFGYANLKGANLTGADFSFTILKYANMKNANFTNTNFTNATLEWATLWSMPAGNINTNFTNTNFTNADMTQAWGWGGTTPGAIFSGASTYDSVTGIRWKCLTPSIGDCIHPI